jgi:hypothetical protein
MAEPSIDDVLDRLEDEMPDDDAEPTPAAPAAAAEPPAPAEPAEPAAPAPAATEPAGDSWLDTLPPEAAKEIRRLRGESQNYRQRAQAAESAFAGLDEPDRAYMIDLVRKTGDSDPAVRREAAQEYRAIAEYLAGEGIDMGGDDGGAQQQYLTADDLNRVLDQRERQRSIEMATQGVIDEAKGLGYDTESPEYIQLLWIANNRTGGDIKAAHAEVLAEKQRWVDHYLAQQQAAADGGVTPAPPTGVAPSGQLEPPKSLAEAKAAMDGFLDAQGIA